MTEAGPVREVEWPTTIWSEARQVTGLNGWPTMAGDDAPPAVFFAALRAAGRDAEAAMFLAQALPRFGAVAWAMSVVEGADTPSPEPVAALKAVRTWLSNPSEANRRRAGEDAGPTDPPSAATLCALAVFHVGGSIAPAEQPAVAPPRGATGRFAGAAVITATALAQDPDDVLRRALDEGDSIARTRTENKR